MGAGSLGYEEFSQKEDLCSGGLSVRPSVQVNPHDNQQVEQGILLSSHCLDANQRAMMDLWKEIFSCHSSGPHWTDSNRLAQLVQQDAAHVTQELVNSGHMFAVRRAQACLGGVASRRELLNGVEQIRSAVERSGLQEYSSLLKSFKEVSRWAMQRGDMRVYLAAGRESLKSLDSLMVDFVSSMSNCPHPIDVQDKTVFDTSTLLHLYMENFQVNFVARAFPAVSMTHKMAAPLSVLAKLLTSRYLHREIREKGGAYGSGAVSSSGYVSFYSYRDPNSTHTLEKFQSAVEWASRGEFSSQDVSEAQLAVFQQLDAPVVSHSRGFEHFLNPDLTRCVQQQYRDRLFAVDRRSLVEATRRYLIDQKSSSVVIGPRNESLQKQGWKCAQL